MNMKEKTNINKIEEGGTTMFKYMVIGTDCNGAGYEEEWIQYEGFDRSEAIEAKRICENVAIRGWIIPLTHHSDGWYSSILAKRKELEIEKEMKRREEYMEYMSKHQDEYEPEKNKTHEEEVVDEEMCGPDMEEMLSIWWD